jgi:hypothetical protein
MFPLFLYTYLLQKVDMQMNNSTYSLSIKLFRNLSFYPSRLLYRNIIHAQLTLFYTQTCLTVLFRSSIIIISQKTKKQERNKISTPV